MKNTFGKLFQCHTFGESHGPALGVVVDGMPAGVEFDQELLLRDLMRRRPGRWGNVTSEGVSARQEEDLPEVLSGVYQNKTLGTPIAIIVRNHDARSTDYAHLVDRQGHADRVWRLKYQHVDPRGGGRSSGRETIGRVIGGSLAKMLLRHLLPDLRIVGYLSQIGPLSLSNDEWEQASNLDIDQFVGRFPSLNQSEKVRELLAQAQKQGESWGGKVVVRILRLPVGLGQPVFHKLKSDLTMGVMSVGAVSSVEIGQPINLEVPGSVFHHQKQTYGGILGGISTGDEVIIQVTFKPTSSILDVAKKGRHDPCVAIRAVPVIEAMVALVLADHVLWRRLDRV
ncbi:MAG: chorismate synthase [Bdellovibrionaceae bacterium]|nr:chorismate synthase [Pseudobdellovibrionaceae bacterium]MDW8190139.1 chorismate synthase [Pseudobdellovibrionaceae bacterium]